MKRPILISTGTLVGRVNAYDLTGGLAVIRSCFEEGLCRGVEWMMLGAFYSQRDEAVRSVRECGVPVPVIHCDKDVGTLLSDAGTLSAAGRQDDAAETKKKAVDLFRLNCVFAEALAVPRMVLHLWGGYASDRQVEYNISLLPEFEALAGEHGVRLLIENVPSSLHDPLSNWKRLLPVLGNGGLIFDTRFGKLHDQIRETLTDPAVTPRIEHVHISDFGGNTRDFAALRPVLHPGEGKVDFSAVAALLDAIGYAGTVTLESPVMSESGRDTAKLEHTLRLLGDLF